MKYINLAQMFFEKVHEKSENEAYRFKNGGNWQSFTYKEAIEQSKMFAAGLASLGIRDGDHVAIMSNNRMEWALIDYAVMALGAVLIPIYPTLAFVQVKFILEDARAAVFIVENEDLLEYTDTMCHELLELNTRIVVENNSSLRKPWLTYETVRKAGLNFLSQHPNYIQQQINKITNEKTATIIYTSGTTGEPKGVILTHKNILSNLESASSIFQFYPDDLLLSFLPLSHIFERTIGHFLSCYHGIPVAYAESIDTIAQNIIEVRPTLLTAVPRLFEKMHTRIIENIAASSKIKQKLFNFARAIGSRLMQKKMKKQIITASLKLRYKLAYILVIRKLRARLGGRIRFMVSGGAPLPQEIAEFFDAMGLRVLEGYGLTETSPAVAINRLDSFKYGSVGQPLPGVHVRIAEDGEILVKGDLIMRGYFNKKEETDLVIDQQGWFYTGDIGFLDPDGFLTITDRKKNIIVTSGGKNIAPVPLEHALLKSDYIDQVVVIGDRRHYCTAVIVPNRQLLLNYSQENQLQSNSFEELLDNDKTRELFRQEIDRLTSFASRYETIKDFCLIAEPFSQENGQLTPTLKIRRNVVEEVYAEKIAAMYQ
jgi:long-chain acyl-CoA synthetase